MTFQSSVNVRKFPLDSPEFGRKLRVPLFLERMAVFCIALVLGIFAEERLDPKWCSPITWSGSPKGFRGFKVDGEIRISKVSNITSHYGQISYREYF